ncbi:hypothetical protein BV20DRAFT_923732, partial [Pilatotrama ljubarskyi]
QMPFKHTLVNQFSITFDMYLNILHHVDLLIHQALRRDAPNWRMLNVCAPCLYKLEGKPELIPVMLVTMDGNQSLKPFDDKYPSGSSLIDTRTACTDFWISAEQVDRFKDEVKAQKVSPAPQKKGGQPQQKTTQSRAPQVQSGVSTCVDRWHNAGPEVRKKMLVLFTITGIFVCLCHHRDCLVMCDMVKSRELMKYPLAIIDKLTQVYGGDIKVGYNVACTLDKILRRSLIGARVVALNITGVVPSFHGHSHNRQCHVDWHPLYMDGVGKENFEGCERCFSESNTLAPGTRLATVFHRQQALEQHFGFWSEQKHTEAGKFIHDNYCQALDIIKTDSEALDVCCNQLTIGAGDFELYIEQEREYLRSQKLEPPQLTAHLDYVEQDTLIMKAKQAQINSMRTKAWTSRVRCETIHEEVLQCEEELSIVEHWQPGQLQYDKMFRELGYRQYRQALEKLEQLVVQRLFEMSADVSDIGYKLGEKLGKALKARATAIKKATAKYNARAQELRPLRPTLAWNDIVNMSTVADFDLLRDTRQDLRQLHWAQPSNHCAMNMYFSIKRACEEIYRLNVEILRLITFMLDEHVDFYHAITENLAANPPLVHELFRRWQ